jgi:hypothetical protein
MLLGNLAEGRKPPPPAPLKKNPSVWQL